MTSSVTSIFLLHFFQQQKNSHVTYCDDHMNVIRPRDLAIELSYYDKLYLQMLIAKKQRETPTNFDKMKSTLEASKRQPSYAHQRCRDRHCSLQRSKKNICCKTVYFQSHSRETITLFNVTFSSHPQTIIISYIHRETTD